MDLQPKSGPDLHFWGFITINFLRGWIVSPAPNPQPEDQASVFMTPRDRVAQLYPQALSYSIVIMHHRRIHFHVYLYVSYEQIKLCLYFWDTL
jgi:hypothetical protein